MAEEKKLPFISVDENGKRAAKLGEEWAKWVLDILRNFVVVAFLFYVAQKSGMWYMWLIAGVGFLALYMFVFGYISQAQFNLGPAQGATGCVLRIILLLVCLAITGVFSIATFTAFTTVISQISIIQGK